MSPVKKALLVLGPVLGAVLAFGGVVAWQVLYSEYQTQVQFCPVGAATADVIVYQRSALDGRVVKTDLSETRCDEVWMGTAVNESMMRSVEADRLPAMVIIASSGGKEQRTLVIRLPQGEGYQVEQGAVRGWRENSNWMLFLETAMHEVPASEFPTIG